MYIFPGYKKASTGTKTYIPIFLYTAGNKSHIHRELDISVNNKVYMFVESVVFNFVFPLALTILMLSCKHVQLKHSKQDKC